MASDVLPRYRPAPVTMTQHIQPPNDGGLSGTRITGNHGSTHAVRVRKPCGKVPQGDMASHEIPADLLRDVDPTGSRIEEFLQILPPLLVLLHLHLRGHVESAECVVMARIRKERRLICAEHRAIRNGLPLLALRIIVDTADNHGR